MELKGSFFSLRDWQHNDVTSLQEQANNIQVSRFLFDIFPYPYTQADAESWVSSQIKQSPLTNFVISVDSQVAGGIEFRPDRDIHRYNASLGYWLGESFWGRGIMTAAVNLLVNYAFAHFELTRIQAHVSSNNPASMRVLEKAGFKKEGILKQAIVKHGEVLDEHLYAILKPY